MDCPRCDLEIYEEGHIDFQDEHHHDPDPVECSGCGFQWLRDCPVCGIWEANTWWKNSWWPWSFYGVGEGRYSGSFYLSLPGQIIRYTNTNTPTSFPIINQGHVPFTKVFLYDNPLIKTDH